ncbi:hypothetical protein RHCRD62_30090 [Rhodococcus sp. RD6.2]|nr:hypothetical protein RHCRD62_30090 [Rhodococcus sp. RD6.2]
MGFGDGKYSLFRLDPAQWSVCNHVYVISRSPSENGCSTAIFEHVFPCGIIGVPLNDIVGEAISTSQVVLRYQR